MKSSNFSLKILRLVIVRKGTLLWCCILLGFIFVVRSYAQTKMACPQLQTPVYGVAPFVGFHEVVGNWKGLQLKKIEAIKIDNPIRGKAKFLPQVKAKMAYDMKNIYVIFHVRERFVYSIATAVNVPEWKDSAVEFFFAPYTDAPETYFNLEVNCNGIPFLGYKSSQRTYVDTNDIAEIEIAHSLPVTVDPEIERPTTWTIEYRTPLNMLKKYVRITHPQEGTVWRGPIFIKSRKTIPIHII